mgnify:FL=1
MEDTEKIKGIIKSIFDAFKDGDTHEIESYLHEEATVWDVFTPDIIVGKNELEAFHERDQAQKDSRGDLSIKLDEPMIRVNKDFAIATYCLEFDYKEPNALNGKVRVTDLFILEDEKWKILHHHEGIVPKEDR